MNVKAARLMTTALGAACGFLVLAALLQYAGFGRGYRWAPDDPDSAPTLPGGSVDEKPLKLPPSSAFAEVDAHPLFNEDREPTPAGAEGEGESDAPLSPLNITLTGIVSTSSVKIAMVQDKARNQSVALKVGMPLEGDQASWTLVEVKPRSVVFRSAANERTEVELETSVAQPARPSNVRPTRTAANTNNNAARGNARSNTGDQRDSGDLAKRIEERRRQMREDAENQRNQAGKGKQPPQKPQVPPKK
jgi:general secretion pathway protein N